jgi:hypothetical protein
MPSVSLASLATAFAIGMVRLNFRSSIRSIAAVMACYSFFLENDGDRLICFDTTVKGVLLW